MDVVRWGAQEPERLAPGLTRVMVNTEHLTIATIALAAGTVVPRHAHANEQVANVVSGRLRFVVDEGEVVVGPGESVVLGADEPHEVHALEDAVVLDVFSPRRDDWLAGDDAYLRR
jgi:quercetin dioxygenase-like cupin family protein